MRSKLFVPGSRPELFEKALAGAADSVCFDLEDAVAEPRKNEARDAVRDFLRSGAAAASGKTLIVRINALTGLTCDTNIRLLRESILTRSRTFGPVSLRAALNA